MVFPGAKPLKNNYQRNVYMYRFLVVDPFDTEEG